MLNFASTDCKSALRGEKRTAKPLLSPPLIQIMYCHSECKNKRGKVFDWSLLVVSRESQMFEMDSNFSPPSYFKRQARNLPRTLGLPHEE